MRVVLAVDSGKVYIPALSLLARLSFENVRVSALHVIEIGHGIAMLPSANVYWHKIKSLEDSGQGCLDEALGFLKRNEIEHEAVLLKGHISQKLIEFADGVVADLIVAGSERKGRWGSFFFGSVTRALSINANQSFLVSKQTTSGDGHVHAVVATDHSEYATSCVEQILNWKPKGLKKVTLVTAFTTDISSFDYALQDVNVNVEEVFATIGNLLEQKSEALCGKFREQGIETEHIVKYGDTQEAIVNAMETTGAELLVLGAHTRTLMQRATLGSTSMFFVVNSPYSTLVLRN